MVRGRDEHIIEAIGRCRVVVRDGRVVEVGKPLISGCPLAEIFVPPVTEITPEAVRANIEGRIRGFGMCTQDRVVLSDQDFVLFGASEILSCAVRSGMLECAVVACDGAGSVIAASPSLIQGIGGRMSGLVKTSPIPEVIRRIEAHGGIVPDKEGASIDQLSVVGAACRAGYRRVGVTVAVPGDAEAIRRRFPECLVVGVHLTGLSEAEAARMTAACDLVALCASATMRRAVGKRALVQAGTAVPVIALTVAGKEALLARVRETGRQVLVKSASLPVVGGDGTEPTRPSGPHPLV